MDWNMLCSNVTSPTWEQVTKYIGSPLWPEFNEHIKPCMEHSRCSMQAGWNITYKKSGNSLCTLYPMEGYFIALVVIGDHELTEAELLMPLCFDFVQTVFNRTKSGTDRNG